MSKFQVLFIAVDGPFFLYFSRVRMDELGRFSTDLLCLLMLASGISLLHLALRFDFFFLVTGGLLLEFYVDDLHDVRILMSNTIWNLMYRSEEHAS